ncbi:hypothetical protein HZA97_02235 [Candidatus Woesearchaeota archaeon]|nr:hypothetical protein [Candidatus Woesearchaeota archaeon]
MSIIDWFKKKGKGYASIAIIAVSLSAGAAMWFNVLKEEKELKKDKALVASINDFKRETEELLQVIDTVEESRKKGLNAFLEGKRSLFRGHAKDAQFKFLEAKAIFQAYLKEMQEQVKVAENYSKFLGIKGEVERIMLKSNPGELSEVEKEIKETEDLISNAIDTKARCVSETLTLLYKIDSLLEEIDVQLR